MSADDSKKKDYPEGGERRHNFELRERLDELIELARNLSRESSDMSQGDLDEARTRVEWLAEEIWRAAVYGPLEEMTRREASPADEEESD